MKRYVALIRGINVGGHRKLPMGELRTALTEAGLVDVTTYIQSGNVILSSPAGPDDVATTIANVIEASFGFRPVVVVRTPAQLRQALAHHPFADRTDDGTKLHVVFCAAKPKAAGVAAIDHACFAPDELACKGTEIFAYYPNGAGRSKVVLDSKALGTELTARNLKTIAKLVELAR